MASDAQDAERFSWSPHPGDLLVTNDQDLTSADGYYTYEFIEFDESTFTQSVPRLTYYNGHECFVVLHASPVNVDFPLHCSGGRLFEGDRLMLPGRPIVRLVVFGSSDDKTHYTMFVTRKDVSGDMSYFKIIRESVV